MGPCKHFSFIVSTLSHVLEGGLCREKKGAPLPGLDFTPVADYVNRRSVLLSQRHAQHAELLGDLATLHSGPPEAGIM